MKSPSLLIPLKLIPYWSTGTVVLLGIADIVIKQDGNCGGVHAS